MSLMNWISITIFIALLSIGIITVIYYRKKVRDLDGFMGIVSSDDKEEKSDTDEW